MPKKLGKSSRATESIREYVSAAGQTLKVDADKGVIAGVKILGMRSKNGREYTTECINGAAKLYEGAKVNVNHPKGSPTGPRDYQDRIGQIRNVSVQKDGLYADFTFNPKHALAEQLCWDADHAPENVGFSHNVEARTERRDGTVYVEEIHSVQAVDLVADPATTQGLFESAELPDDPGQRELAEHGLSAVSDARTILLGEGAVEQKRERLLEVLASWKHELYKGEVGDTDEIAEQIGKVNQVANDLIYDAIWDRDGKYPILEDKKARVLSILADWESELKKLPTASGETTSKEHSSMEWTDITVESLKEHRNDLVEVLTGTDKTSQMAKDLQEAQNALKETNEKLEAIEAEKAEQTKTIAITEELKAAKLDASDKTVVSEAFMGLLKSAQDATARKVLIEDRVALLASRGTRASAPLGIIGGMTGIAPGTTAKDTLAQL